MAMNSVVNIERSDIASFYSFIYCICSLEQKAVYFGQTRSRYGALGRLSQHISDDWSCNTFRQRLKNIYDIENCNFNNIIFYAIPFSPYKNFLSDASSYRESVEYLVQNEMINHIISQNIPLSVISRVFASGYERNQIVITESLRIITDMKLWIDKL